MSLLGEAEIGCQDVRTALHEQSLTGTMEAHIAACHECAEERRVMAVVRSSLMLEAPPELSARLLALAAPAPQLTRLDLAIQKAVVLPAPPELSERLRQLVPGAVPVAQPVRPRWLMSVYAFTMLLLGIVLVVAGQMYGMALQELGIGEIWNGVAQLPGIWLEQVYGYFPQGRYVVDAFFMLQRALQWVLIGVLMWAVLEMRTRRAAGYQRAAVRS
jgi:hypothetical protein